MNSMLGECMTPRRTAVLVSVALLFAGMETSIGNAQEIPAPVKAVQLIGLTGVKQNAKGTLKVENGNLQFVHGKTNADITAASIQDVVTGDDTQRSVGGTVGVMSMAAPYGGGRFLSLFRKKIDTLTIQYRDANDGLHGAIFTMPPGAANGADLVVLHSTVRGFKAGSERARQVTTVAGATSITVHCQFTSYDAKPLLERDVDGKVRFFGGNLKATYDFAKKAAHAANENFSSPHGK